MTRGRPTLALLLVIACSTRAPWKSSPGSPAPTIPRSASDPSARVVRVALSTVPGSRIGGTQEFTWEADQVDHAVFARGRAGEDWRIERASESRRVRAVSSSGAATPWVVSLTARPSRESFITIAGKRFRGSVAVIALDTGVAIVNRLGVEDYLRGVVPLEMGTRPRGDSSALQAQAVASRSYALLRAAGRTVSVPFDLRASTADQVYGGVDAETEAANAAIDATAGLVLLYDGRVADAPFHSTCGGVTAGASEVWRNPDQPYLRSVSDRIPGSDRYYCDIAPRFRWERTLAAPDLNAALAQYLKAYAAVPGGDPGTAKEIGVRSRTGSGRVAVLEVETDKGVFAVRGNDIRYVVRPPGGEILPSTYFSVEPEYRDGRVSRVTLRGQGYGHGVGMCQWGAIGRARAGESFRSILRTYYPGTTVGRFPVE